jgi:hypothetical protein
MQVISSDSRKALGIWGIKLQLEQRPSYPYRFQNIVSVRKSVISHSAPRQNAETLMAVPHLSIFEGIERRSARGSDYKGFLYLVNNF